MRRRMMIQRSPSGFAAPILRATSLLRLYERQLVDGAPFPSEYEVALTTYLADTTQLTNNALLQLT